MNQINEKYTTFEKIRMWMEDLPLIGQYLNPVLREGDEIIVLDCPSTKFPDQYSEGVFVWIENRLMMTSLEYQENKGGDPEVLYHWLKNKGAEPDFQIASND